MVAIRGLGPLLVGLALVTCSLLGANARASSDRRIQATLDAVRTRGALPGITLGILVHDGTLMTFASGVTDMSSQIPMTGDAVMPVGSIGKQFFAATALALEHAGKVDLDARIDRWFRKDEWFQHVQNAHQLTLRLLLMHRGGVGDHRPSPKFAAALRDAFGRSPFDADFRIAPEKLVDMLRDEPPLFAANGGFAYSESGYLLAGMALERACRCKYYDELQHRLLRPLKLDHTHPATTRKVAGLVNGYTSAKLVALGFPMATVRNGEMLFSPATEWTGGGLYSNVTDLVRWSTALYEGKALAKPYVDELLAGYIEPPSDGEGYGLGVRVAKTPLGTSYGHAGEFPGYVSVVLYFRDLGSSIAMQANTSMTDAPFMIAAAAELMQIATEASP